MRSGGDGDPSPPLHSGACHRRVAQTVERRAEYGYARYDAPSLDGGRSPLRSRSRILPTGTKWWMELLVSPGPRLSHQRAVFRMARLLGGVCGGLADWRSVRRSGERSSWKGERPCSPICSYCRSSTGVSAAMTRPWSAARDRILSPSTAHHDRLVKRRLSAEGGGVLDSRSRCPASRTLGAWRRESRDRHGAFHWLPLPVGEPFELDLPEFFSRVLGAR